MMLKRIAGWLRTQYTSHKKIINITAASLGVLLLIVGIFAWTSGGSDQVSRTELATDSQDEQVEVTVVPSPLTGLSVEKALAERPVTAFIIENSPEARPQSGMQEAGVVFESIAEGGITRFVVFYQEARPDIIGPVRSLRPYFVDWILAFDASIGHVGGSVQALEEAQSLGVKSLNQFYNGDFYVRTTDRYAPHNVYTDFDKIDALNKAKGFTSSEFTPWLRKADKPLAVPKAKTISVDISSYTYNSSYIYEAATNSYKRSEAGEAHRDRETAQQLKPKVVIVIRVGNRIIANGRYEYDLVGSGKATIFQDGDVIAGTWKKDSRSSQMKFVDANNEEIALNAGQVWITAVSPDQGPEYSP